MLHNQMIPLLVLLFSLIGIGSAQADIILNYDFENKSYEGIKRQYQTKICSQKQSYVDNSLFQIVKDKTRADNYVLKHHIRNCDERSELAIPSGFFKREQEYWIGWSYFFPKDFIKLVPGGDNYTIINQMIYNKSWIDQDQGKTLFECHATTSRRGVYKTIGSPGSEMIISPDGEYFTYKLKFYKGKDSQGRAIFGCENFQIPATVERWEDFVMNVKFSDNPKQGFLKLWKNGELYIDRKVALLRPGAEVGSWKIGAYVGDPGNGERIIYTDELKIGDANSSYKEVSSPGAKLPAISPPSAKLSLAARISEEVSSPGAQLSIVLPPSAKLSSAARISSVSQQAASVPEPSTVFGLMALGASLLLKQKRRSS